MIHAYDQRPIGEIRSDLLYRPTIDKDELVCACIVLCDRIGDLQHRLDEIENIHTKPNPYHLTDDKLNSAE